MKSIRRLFGAGSDQNGESAPEIFTIPFAGGQRPRPAVRVSRSAAPRHVITALDLPHPTHTILISGGASRMEAQTVSILRAPIEDGLVRFLGSRSISLIDGGSTSGIMPLLGAARARRNYSFPLIGVAPEALVGYPGHALPDSPVELDAAHSHFVLTDGDGFGAESELMIRLAYTLSGRGTQKRLLIVVNGGDIVRKEAHLCSTREPRFPLLVLEGSGRFADALSAARQTGSSDPLIREILDQGIVHFLPVKAGADNLYRWLENFFDG